MGLMRLLKTTWTLLRLVIWVALLLVEGCFWLGAFMFGAGVTVMDIVKAIRSRRDGVLRCPRGHEVPTTGGVYECTACGWVWEGDSMLRCPNPECQAPTPYVNCPEAGCGLSVRNPWRWGRE